MGYIRILKTLLERLSKNLFFFCSIFAWYVHEIRDAYCKNIQV